MLTATSRSRVTTVVGLVVAGIATWLSDPQNQAQLSVILPGKYATALQLVGLIMTALGPSLKGHSSVVESAAPQTSTTTTETKR